MSKYKGKYTKQLLEQLVAQSNTKADVIRALGLKMTGGTQNYIGKLICLHGIDTSHFKNPISFLNKSGRKKRWDEVLVEMPLGHAREDAFRLRRALIESGRQYKCAGKECPIDDKWLGKEIRLQVNHIDGNWLNNKSSNLEFLCPNCHSQTHNFSGTKGKTLLTGVVSNWKERKHKVKKCNG